MPNNFVIEEFTSYKLLLFSHNTEEKIQYSIELPLPDGRAILRFVKGGLPENKENHIGSKNIYYAYFHQDQFYPMVDVLRNEKPLFFYYNHDNHECYITTSSEPVGEHEMSDD